MITIQFWRQQPTWLRATLALVLLLACARVVIAESYDKKSLEDLASSTYPEARVDLVSFKKIETSTFKCRDGSSTCVTTVGSMIEERWSKQLQTYFRSRDFYGDNINASFFRSYRTAASARYGNRVCTETSEYQQQAMNSLQHPGSRTYECTEDGSAPTRQTSGLTSPPTLHVAQENGSFSGTWLASDTIIQDYSINLSSRMELTFNGPPLRAYQVTLKVGATRVDLNPKTGLFSYTPVPCGSIKVAGNKADSGCNVRVFIPAGTDPKLPNIQVFDVTPVVSSAPYISYDVSVLGVPTEK